MEEENKQEEQMVSVPKNKLDELMTRMAILEKQQVTGVGVAKAKEAKNRHVRVRLLNGKPIIGFRNVGTNSMPRYTYQVPHGISGQVIDMIDVILKDTEKPIQIPYLDLFDHTEIVNAEVIKKHADEWNNETGELVDVVDVDFDNFRSTANGQVEAVVSGVTYTYEVKLPDETVVQLKEEVINI